MRARPSGSITPTTMPALRFSSTRCLMIQRISASAAMAACLVLPACCCDSPADGASAVIASDMRVALTRENRMGVGSAGFQLGEKSIGWDVERILAQNAADDRHGMHAQYV